MYCCSAQDSKMDYKRRFLLGGSKQKVQQHQQCPLPELGRALSTPVVPAASAAPLGSLSAAGSCHHAMPHSTPIADIQQGISKYLDALNVFCRASTFLTDLFSTVFRNSHYARAATQLRDVQEHVMEAASRLTSAIKPEIAKMLMELSAGAANFTDQKEFSLQDIEVLGRCFLTVVQVHFQFLTQALQKVQPVAHSCFAEVFVPEKKNSSGGISGMGHTPELEEAVRSWRGAAEATSRLRERGCDGRLAGIEVQQLFCSQSAAIPEHQLKELNIKIDSALQAYKIALESLGHCEYAMKAGFHLNPKAIEASLQGCCSDAEAQQTGRRQTPPQPMQCELPTVPVQIGSHFLKGVSFNESAADNLKLKTHTMLQLIKEAGCCNGITPRDDFPVTEVLNQVCPSTWRGACKTAVQLLFGQAGLVVVDTAQIENKEAYAPQISLEGSRIVVQVPSTWCLKEDPATMSLLQRSLDPEKTLGLVDVLYTAVLDLNRWRAGREQALPCIQIQLQREICDFGNQSDLPSGSGNKASGGLQKTFSKLTSRFTKKTSCTSSSSSTNYSIPSTPSKNIFIGGCLEEKAKMPSNIDSRLQSILNIGNFPRTTDPSQSAQNSSNQMANGFLMERRDNFLRGDDGKDEKVGSDPEFARYVAGVSQAMQQKRQVQHGRRPGNPRGHWPPMDDAHRTWPFPEFFTEGDGLHSGWSGTQGDSASSSDETSSANGDSLFSMFSGPDLVAAVKQRRKHSSGEQETSTLPSPPLLTTVEDMNQDNKTKTWPPKAPWQHPSPLPSTLPSPSTPLYAVSSPGSQWNDTMQMLQSPVWAATSDCSAASFTYVQSPPQPPPQPAHKAVPKGFKAFPGKAERRPAYLPQY
ncbi:granule associated Rac and RHOG effector protein 1 isoform X5 [Manis pentadactyla]|uniref:granule associated Rac and RHOG effector protein 1 isoform X5 n=1 Tax=Manis pentadactyla TaxID=143292 RepID=UPI00255CC6B9|nr:granule associated Rac and RHOG effector protein 1 isoform X5 [Manis pentadactyla]